MPSPSFYKDAIRLIIQHGGDTDTNACIVGGLVGALVGVKSFPEDMLIPILSFDCAKNGVKRPEFLSVKRHAIPGIAKLIKLRPQKNLIINNIKP